MEESHLEQLNDLQLQILELWGDLHNSTKTVRVAVRDIEQFAREAEIAVDTVFTELMKRAEQLYLQACDQRARQLFDGKTA